MRWASKLAFLLIFLVPLSIVPSGQSPYGPVFPTPYTGITSAILPPSAPTYYLPLSQSPCSIWINGWCNTYTGLWLVEPLGAMQAFLSGQVDLLLDLAVALAVVLLIVVLVGAMFCSWACPIGTLVDSFDNFVERFLPKIEAKRAKIVDKNLQAHLQDALAQKANPAVCVACPITRLVTKNGVVAAGILAGSLGAASVMGFNAFCLVCPIGIASRGLFHLKATTFATRAVGGKIVSSPTYSSLLYSGPFYLELIIFPVIAVLVSLKERRFWCNKLCPVGALINITSSLNPFIKPKMIQENCVMTHCPPDCQDNRIGYCSACRKQDNYKCMRDCPAQINLAADASLNRCTKCMECYIACDHDAIKVRAVAKPDIFRVPGFLRNWRATRRQKAAATADATLLAKAKQAS
jgi:ferredoxin-type protein NapH